ncbi:hypothetical protein [Arcticibacter eurypsychrophilus]|uniref:hypothetical protein n=1 Tax=Arcticibacter eurypsychrophilus TaxID=1434752 RepID=UPI000ADC9274|nr:hypothetical protein [Arcticibacter eurypsychrophilus]
MIQDTDIGAIHTKELSNRMFREVLLKNGFIKEVTKGWFIAANPSEKEGETTSWYSAYWEFCSKFLEYKYGTDWCISADHSLAIHAGNWSVPQQLIVRSSYGNNRPISFLHNTSLFNRKADLPSSDQIIIEKGIRMYNLQSSLVYCSTAVFDKSSLDARTALSLIRDASEILPILLENGHSTIEGRLVGAFRNIQRDRIADQLLDTMRQVGYDIREDDPFKNKLDVNLSLRERSPFVR